MPTSYVQARIQGQCFADLALSQWKGTLCFRCGTVTFKEQTNARVSPKKDYYVLAQPVSVWLSVVVFGCLTNAI